MISPGTTLATLRDRKPLVHQITNYVVMNETANATLALGALPVMAHAPEEVAEMAGIASALVINIGTLSHHWIEAMLIAGRAAGDRGIPIVLDPAAAEALAAFGVAAEDAAQGAWGPGTFHASLYDALWRLDPASLDGRVKISE